MLGEELFLQKCKLIIPQFQLKLPPTLEEILQLYVTQTSEGEPKSCNLSDFVINVFPSLLTVNDYTADLKMRKESNI